MDREGERDRGGGGGRGKVRVSSNLVGERLFSFGAQIEKERGPKTAIRKPAKCRRQPNGG